MKKKIFISVIFIANLLLSHSSFADRKPFGLSYLSTGGNAREFECEIWNQVNFGKGIGYYQHWQPRIEFEYSPRDNFKTSLYLNFDEVKTEDDSLLPSPFSYHGTSVELLWTPFSSRHFYLPAFYLETSMNGFDLEFEPKLIFSQRFGSWIGAVNLIGEIEHEYPEHELEGAFNATAGLAFEASDSWSLGVEGQYLSTWEGLFEEQESSAIFAGPTVSWMTSSFYFTLNFVAQVSAAPATHEGLNFADFERYQIRTILGIPFR